MVLKNLVTFPDTSNFPVPENVNGLVLVLNKGSLDAALNPIFCPEVDRVNCDVNGAQVIPFVVYCSLPLVLAVGLIVTVPDALVKISMLAVSVQSLDAPVVWIVHPYGMNDAPVSVHPSD